MESLAKREQLQSEADAKLEQQAKYVMVFADSVSKNAKLNANIVDEMWVVVLLQS